MVRSTRDHGPWRRQRAAGRSRKFPFLVNLTLGEWAAAACCPEPRLVSADPRSSGWT